MRFIPTWAEATIAPLAKAPSKTTLPGCTNTAAGSFALANSTGDYNIALGTTAGFNQTFGSNNIYIGDTGDAGQANVIAIGAAPPSGVAYTNTYIGGIFNTIRKRHAGLH